MIRVDNSDQSINVDIDFLIAHSDRLYCITQFSN